MKVVCGDVLMRTVTRKLARLYLTRKLNDNLKTYESKRFIKKCGKLN